MSLLDNLKAINIPQIELKEVKEDVKKEERFIIVHSKDISREDKDEFSNYGKVVLWDNRFQNLKYTDIEFDYLFVDIRDKIARYNLACQEIEVYNVVLYVSWYEKIEEFIEQIMNKTKDSANVITSVPNKCISKDHFNKSLLTEKLSSPSCIKSFLKTLYRAFAK